MNKILLGKLMRKHSTIKQPELLLQYNNKWINSKKINKNTRNMKNEKKNKQTRDFNRWVPEIILTPLTHDFLLPKGAFQEVEVFH